jgi:hypothetical protein
MDTVKRVRAAVGYRFTDRIIVLSSTCPLGLEPKGGLVPKLPIVTAQAFIRNVADRLKARRIQLRWTVMDVQAKGGPNYHTVQKVEAGHVAAPDIMEKHVTALGLTLRDVYVAALTPPGHEALFSHAASEVARIYDQATPEGQEALRALARVLDRPGRHRRLAGRLVGPPATPASSLESPSGAPASATGTD